jgi:PAS domain S-box-containing protein
MATILVADDFAAGRAFLSDLLGRQGHRVLEASDGAEALAVVRVERPDLVLADIIMPAVDGYEFVRRLRGDPAVAATPVIFFAGGYREQEARALARACGVFRVLGKPAEPETILQAVAAALAGAAAAPPAPPQDFDREHLQVLTDKLAEKVRERGALFDNTPDALLLADDQGRCLDANPAACALLGYGRAELLRMTVAGATRAAGGALAGGRWQAFLAAGRESGEDAVRRRDGGTAEVEYVAVARVVPGVHFITLRDVTARKQAEKALRETQEHLARLLEHIPAPVWVHSSDGRLRLVNRSWELLWRRQRGDVLGRREDEVYPPELARTFLASDRQVLATGAPLTWEETIDGPDGRGSFHTIKFPLRDAAGRVEAVGGVALDVTARRQAEERLREYSERLQALSRRLLTAQEEERRRIARELHDEVGQILTAVSIGLQAAQESAGDAARPRLEESAAVVNRAIQQVRDLSLDLRPPMLDALGLEATLCWYLNDQAERAGFAADFASRLPEGRLPPEVEVACFRVAQEALTNVARHARARRVRLDLERRGAALHLAVRDDGAGFDPEAARQGAGAGQSFGLLGMEERVRLAGGEIAIASAPGRGTEVHATFPLS